MIKSVCLISFLFLWLKQLSAYRYRQTINYFWLWLRADLIENDKIHFTESELLHENFGFLFQFTEKFVILCHSVREIISCYAELKHVAKPNMLFMNLSSSFSLSVTFNDKYTHIENLIQFILWQIQLIVQFMYFMVERDNHKHAETMFALFYDVCIIVRDALKLFHTLLYTLQICYASIWI